MRQALWMQIFVFLQPMWHKGKEDVFLILEHSSLRNGGRGGEKKKKTHKKKHEILAFKPLLQETQLKNPTIRKIFLYSNV